ncbi:hypothetical protein H5410_014292 [Solanum commersonii]|uniref:Uncharacterized protein n=1 Tax=Solanum commersonii TaxID=4109 RepID=A0A9J5ZQY7_SOLCO|nr:hypothetical protein H5410_014292 [Solanum commersonii]
MMKFQKEPLIMLRNKKRTSPPEDNEIIIHSHNNEDENIERSKNGDLTIIPFENQESAIHPTDVMFVDSFGVTHPAYPLMEAETSRGEEEETRTWSDSVVLKMILIVGEQNHQRKRVISHMMMAMIFHCCILATGMGIWTGQENSRLKEELAYDLSNRLKKKEDL